MSVQHKLRVYLNVTPTTTPPSSPPRTASKDDLFVSTLPGTPIPFDQRHARRGLRQQQPKSTKKKCAVVGCPGHAKRKDALCTECRPAVTQLCGYQSTKSPELHDAVMNAAEGGGALTPEQIAMVEAQLTGRELSAAHLPPCPGHARYAELLRAGERWQ